eukprot:747116-Hanusia_phi.AAC.3
MARNQRTKKNKATKRSPSELSMASAPSKKTQSNNTAGDHPISPSRFEVAQEELRRLEAMAEEFPLCKELLRAEIDSLKDIMDNDKKGKDDSIENEQPWQVEVAPGAHSTTAPSDPEVSSPTNSESSTEKEEESSQLHADVSAQDSLHDSKNASPTCSQAEAAKGVDESRIEVAHEKKVLKIRIPVEVYPGFNFIGRILGPRGATLKNLEAESGCRLYIRGRGSLRSNDPSLELSKMGQPGYEHLSEDLHILIEFEGPTEQSYKSLSIAENLVKKLLVRVERLSVLCRRLTWQQVPPPSDEIDELKKQQLKDLAILNGTYKENKVLMPVSTKEGLGEDGVDDGSCCR